MKFDQVVHCGMTVPRGTQTQGGRNASCPLRESERSRILIVEDEFLVAMTIEEALLQAGHEIVGIVTTGEEAVQVGTSLRPDLVLMDIRLAGQMTGIEAALELRAKGIPSLFTSAHSDQSTRALGNEAKPLGWLAKPYSENEAVSTVENAIADLKRH